MNPLKRGVLTLLSLAALAFLVFLSQWHRLLFPLGDNEGFYGFYALQMGRGLQLYRDLWDHKPPGLFLQYFLLGRIFPLDEIHLRLCVCVVHLLNAVLLSLLGRKLGLDRISAGTAALFYALFLFPSLLQPWSAEADLLGLPFLLAALTLAFSPSGAASFLSGACFALSLLTKQSVGLVLPAFLAIPGFLNMKKIGIWISGAGVGLAAVLFPIYLDGRFPEFWDSLTRFNRYYVSNSWDFFLSSQPYQAFEFKWLLTFLLLYGLPLAGLLLFLVRRTSSPQAPTTRLFVGLWFFGALASCFLSAYFYSYYFIALLPPLSLALACELQKGPGMRFYRVALFLGWALAAALATGLNVKGTGDKIFSFCQYAIDRLEADKSMGQLLRREAAPGDKLFCWSCDPTLYAYSGLPMAVVRTPVINHLRFLTRDAQAAQARFAEELPKYCVVSRAPQIFPEPDWLVQKLQENYMRVNFMPGTDTQGLELYVLSGEKN